jgi:pyruvate/2-oxoglutarate dehydrogenase complex dihydrolipoamide dehydrogenase (E3) component
LNRLAYTSRMRPHVYLVEAAHGIMPNKDRDAAEVVEQQMVRDEVKLLCCGKPLHVEKTESGKRLTVGSHGSPSDVMVDEIHRGNHPSLPHAS